MKTFLFRMIFSVTFCLGICTLSEAGDKIIRSQIIPIPPAERAQVGRYQLFYMKYESTVIANGDVKVEIKEGLFKLDTATGQLFECSKSITQFSNSINIHNGCIDFEHHFKSGS